MAPAPAPAHLATTAAAARATTAGHRLVARHISVGAGLGLVWGCLTSVWVLLLVLYVVHGTYRRRQMRYGTNSRAVRFLDWLSKAAKNFVLVTLLVCFFWYFIPLKIYQRVKAHRDKKKTAAYAAALTPVNALATAAAVVTVEPPPLPRPTMPMDPVQLAPEEPDLGDPDVVPALHPPAGPPSADATAGTEAAAAPTEPPVDPVIRPVPPAVLAQG